MGVKKGTIIFSQKAAISHTLNKLKKDIINERGEGSSYRPMVAFDVSVDMRKSLSNPRKDSKVSSQFHSIPRVPVVAVSKSVVQKALLYRNHGFDVIIVMDGTYHPLKDEEHTARADRASIKEKEMKLFEAYANPDSHTIDEVLELRKELLRYYS